MNREFAEKLFETDAFSSFCNNLGENRISNSLIYSNTQGKSFDYAAHDAKDPRLEASFEYTKRKLVNESIVN